MAHSTSAPEASADAGASRTVAPPARHSHSHAHSASRTTLRTGFYLTLLLLPYGAVLVALLASSLIAQRSLHDHVQRVADALHRDGLDAGRKAVSQIVGRDPQSLDEAGVARAAIESLAENFSDGVVAPVRDGGGAACV